MQAGLPLALSSEYSEEGARGGCCQQPICPACLPTRLVSWAPTSLSEAAGKPFSQEVGCALWMNLALLGADPNGPQRLMDPCLPPSNTHSDPLPSLITVPMSLVPAVASPMWSVQRPLATCPETPWACGPAYVTDVSHCAQTWNLTYLT